MVMRQLSPCSDTACVELFLYYACLDMDCLSPILSSHVQPWRPTVSNSGASLLPFLKVSLSQNFPNNLDHRLFSIRQCLSNRQCLALSVLCPSVPMSVQPYPNCFHQCSALSIRCPAVPSCVKMSVSVQFCPDRVRGVQHCPAVFSSIQHRPAVFRCLVVPSCSTVSVSVQLRPDSTKCSTLFDIVQQCPTASSSVQQCTRPLPCVFWLHLSFSQWTYILLLSSQPSCFFLALLVLSLLLCEATFIFSSSQYPVPVLFYKCSCQTCYCAMGCDDT